jgi:osmoprotectant transport system ATP-binding protein
VRDLSLEVGDGEVCVLLGPSGCGKTTTMKMINRLIEPSAGRILLGGSDVSQYDPVELRRSIGYVIQQVGLFPHLNVAANVATVPRLLGWDRARIQARVEELLWMVDLDPTVFGRRYPHQLSGGQQQRVGVVRALAADPPLLLMDEPFGALDPVTRGLLQEQFLRLQRDLGKTVVFVTHDLDEAVRLGDRIAVLSEGGVLEQYERPAEVLGRPASRFVVAFVGGDRGVKRLAVVPLTIEHVVPVPTVTQEALNDPLGPMGLTLAAGPSSRAAVVDGRGHLVGWLATSSDSPAPHASGREPGGQLQTVVSSLEPPGPTVRLGASLRDALARLLLEPAGELAVVDDDGTLLGVVTAERLVAAGREPARHANTTA